MPGWPHTSVTCWAGWILAAGVGLLRQSHRLRNITMLVLSVGFAVYGGHPESLIALGLAVVVFVAAYMIARSRVGGGPVLAPLRDLVVGAVCGFGLGAPLLFPGVQLALTSVRRNGTGKPAFPLSHAPNLLLVGLQGRDFTTTAYVGIVVLALAVVGTRVAWKRPEVPALVAVAVVSALLTFLSPADSLLHLVPGGSTVAWSRIVMLLGLSLAVLGAIGLDALVRTARDRLAVRWAAGAFGALGLIVLGLAAASELGLAPAIARHRGSLAWPMAQAVVGFAVAALWLWSGRAGAHSPTGEQGRLRWVPALLLALETGFLVSVGIPSWSVSSTYFATNPAIAALQRTVGSSLVGYGSCRSLRYNTASKNEVGIRPNANIAYGVHEMAVYDPILPADYFRAWEAAGGQRTPPSLNQLGIFCAQISTTTQAREFGVRYVLVAPRHHRPVGLATVLGMIGGERLVFVPNSGPATVTAAPVGGGPVPIDAPASLVPVTNPDPASWRLVVNEPQQSVLRLRLTAVPGWHATIDGQPLGLHSWASGLMLEARVPAGRHVVELHYWPDAFSAGLAVAGATVIGLVTAISTGAVLSRRRRRLVAPTS